MKSKGLSVAMVALVMGVSVEYVVDELRFHRLRCSALTDERLLEFICAFRQALRGKAGERRKRKPAAR